MELFQVEVVRKIEGCRCQSCRVESLDPSLGPGLSVQDPEDLACGGWKGYCQTWAFCSLPINNEYESFKCQNIFREAVILSSLEQMGLRMTAPLS